MTVYAYTDGAARGNPGDSGIGVIFKDEQGATISTLFGFIGNATNNVAEYQALLACLRSVPDTKCSRLIVHSDSQLMVRQLNGEYKVKDPNLRKMFQKVREILAGAPFKFEIRHVTRDLNKEADQLANLGIDSRTPLSI